MTRLDVACVCIDAGIHVGLTVTGEHRGQLIQAFRDQHSGPGHVPEEPPRDWYGKEDQFNQYLAQLRAVLAMATAPANLDVDPGGKL